MPDVIYSSLPPKPTELTQSQMDIARSELNEDTLQVILAYARAVGSSIVNALPPTGVDDTTNLQAAIDRATAIGGSVFIPPGVYNLSQSLTVRDIYGFGLRGSCRNRPLLKWIGLTGSPMIKVTNSQNINLESFQMQGNAVGANRPSAFIESVSDTSYVRTFVPTSLVCKDLMLGTGTSDEAEYGIKYTNTGVGSDTNNSEGSFENVKIFGVIEACVYLGHAQSKAHHFRGCGFVGAKYGIYQLSGSFTWHGGNSSLMSVAAFYLRSANDSILMSAATVESSARFLEVTSAGNGWPITMLNCRFAADMINVDGYAVLIGTKGPNFITGCVFDTGASKIATGWQTAGGTMYVTNNLFAWTSSVSATVFVNANQIGTWVAEPNIYFDGSDTAAQKNTSLISDSSTVHGNAKALFELSSTTKGFLPPRMTTVQRDAIATPPAGLIIYNTTTAALNVFTTGWEEVDSF